MIAVSLRVETDLELRVVCGECGNDLDVGEGQEWHHERTLEVGPCETCMAEAEKMERGRDD